MGGVEIIYHLLHPCQCIAVGGEPRDPQEGTLCFRIGRRQEIVALYFRFCILIFYEKNVGRKHIQIGQSGIGKKRVPQIAEQGLFLSGHAVDSLCICKVVAVALAGIGRMLPVKGFRHIEGRRHPVCSV